MKTCFKVSKLRVNLFGELPFLKPLESLLLRLFMIPTFFLVRANGLEHIKNRNGPVIFAFNHNNALESVLVPACLVYHSGGKKISFIIDWMFGKIPLLEQLFKLMDPVYVYHKRSPLRFIESKRPKTGKMRDTVSLCCERLREGKRVGIFPEGKRNSDPHRLLRAKPGIGHIALISDAPVIPVGINCVSGKKRKKVRALGRMTLNIGKPLHFKNLSNAYRRAGTGSSASASTERERHMLAHEATTRIMSVIAGLCGKEYIYSAHGEKTGTTTKAIRNNNNHTIKEVICPV